LSLRLVPDELWELVQLPQSRPRPRAAAPEDYQQARAWAETEYPVLLAVITQVVKTQLENYSWQLLLALEPFLFGEDPGTNSTPRCASGLTRPCASEI
jgi:hypothetical protein